MPQLDATQNASDTQLLRGAFIETSGIVIHQPRPYRCRYSASCNDHISPSTHEEQHSWPKGTIHAETRNKSPR